MISDEEVYRTTDFKRNEPLEFLNLNKPMGMNLEKMNNEELLYQWRRVKADASNYAKLERELRNSVIARAFPDAKRGTSTFDFGGGAKLVATFPESYKLDQQLINGVLDTIDNLGERAKLRVEGLVKFKAELAVGAYKALGTSLDETDKVIKKTIDKILTVTPGQPQLEFKPKPDK